MTSKYLSCADTAKLLRQALKEAFPGVKFSVRSSTYAGGASIRVGWTDGPTAKMVETVSGKFSGAYFDGMIDYKGYKYHELDGEEVHFGADFIFTERSYSDGVVGNEINAQAVKYGITEYMMPGPATVAAFRKGDFYQVYTAEFSQGRNNLQCEVNAGLAETSFFKPSDVKPSPTAERARCTGDDGYGMGTVGPDGKGGERGYSAIEKASWRSAAGLNTGTEKLA